MHGTLLVSWVGFIGILFGIPLPTTFCFFSLAFSLLFIKYLVCKSIGVKQISSWSRSQLQAFAASVLIILTGSLSWSINNLDGLKTTPTDDLLLAPWSDIFYHARVIGLFAQFASDPATLHPSMSGESLPLYHYGSYIVPSIISSLCDIPSLQIATSFYPVFGMVLTGASMVVLASLVTNSIGVALALLILFFVPDFSFWIPQAWFRTAWEGGHSNFLRWFSYFFFQQVGIAGAYAVAVMGLALAYALRAFQTRSLWLAFIALAVFALACIFKVQIVLAYCMVFTLFVCWNTDWMSKLFRLSFIVAIGIVFFIAIQQLNKIQNAPSFFISTESIIKNFDKLILPIANKLIPFVNKPKINFFYWLYAVPLTGIILFLLTYGLIFPGSLLLAWALRKDKPSQIIIRLLFTTLLGHAFVSLFIAYNTGHGDYYEVNHKTFVWPFYVISFCFSVLLWNYLKINHSLVVYKRMAALCIVVCLVVFTFISSTGVQTKFILPGFINRPIDKGLFASAVYIKNNSLPGEVAQLCENDYLNTLGAITERPIFIVDYVINNPPLTNRQIERFAKVQSILQVQDLATAKSLLSIANITWWLMSPRCQAEWEKQTQPVLSPEGYRLYKTSLF
ncbi:MAG: hypothetical protein V1844_02725 [Pseudomonadota bacterium]